MHKNEIDVTIDNMFGSLLEEALHLGVQYVEALESQRKRQLIEILDSRIV